METLDYVRLVRRRWILISSLALVGVVIAGAVSFLMTPRYQAKTLSIVSVQSVGVPTNGQRFLQEGVLYAQNILPSLADAVTAPVVLNAVVADPDLQLNQTVVELSEDITAEVTPETLNITIAATRNDPDEAAKIANAVTASFRAQAVELTRPGPGQPSPILINTITPAERPDFSVVPRVQFNLLAGLLTGLVLGGVLALVLDALGGTKAGAPVVDGAGLSGRHGDKRERRDPRAGTD